MCIFFFSLILKETEGDYVNMNPDKTEVKTKPEKDSANTDRAGERTADRTSERPNVTAPMPVPGTQANMRPKSSSVSKKR